VAAHVNMGW
jgi:hypothetical protein